jgi:protein-S-isoprenylcysteine O-methyltransferase Ste14
MESIGWLLILSQIQIALIRIFYSVKLQTPIENYVESKLRIGLLVLAVSILSVSMWFSTGISLLDGLFPAVSAFIKSYQLISNSVIYPVVVGPAALAKGMDLSMDPLHLPALVRDTVYYAGFLFNQLGASLLIYTHHVMQHNWTAWITIHSDHRLVTNGPFRLVRHPMYLSLLLYAVGFSLMTGCNLFVMASWSILIGMVYRRIPIEEKCLIEKFGVEYESYCSNVKWKLIPGIC